MINEYISTRKTTGTLRNGTHLSFHRTLSSRLFCVSFVSTHTHSCPLARFAQLYFVLLELRVNSLILESHKLTAETNTSTALVCPKHAVLSLSVLTCISVVAGSFCWRQSSSFVSVCVRTLVKYAINTYLYNCHKMKLEQLYSESSSERFAFGMGSSGCGIQDPRVSEKLVPSRLRETGNIFHYFRLLRLLDFWKESQTSQLLRERAGQHESIMINEYISTRWLYRTLRIGTHLSFHWTLSSRLFWVSFVSTCTHSCPLVRLTQLYFILLALRVSNLIFESHQRDG
ncbi:Hypothetical_protein [Hexamita inflata]|uniref:Hypothetical_protein n=1 Tax=Hexamita inflata TaxID=28002 RepID=A0AA86PTZ8_9EUKA|nr:Hypothetical protein HINF_LOCUS28537 [Hexamita inflata]